MTKHNAIHICIIILMSCSAVILIALAHDTTAIAEPAAQQIEQHVLTQAPLNSRDRMLVYFSAFGTVGVSCITSAYALARIGSAALGAMSEKPEIGGRALVFLGMAEGIAIYGLIVAIMILNKI